MGFKDAADKYRQQMYGSIERKDKEGGRAGAIAYAALLRQMAGMLDSYTDRAFLIREADKYEYVAAVITKWGICDELYRALNDPAPHIKKPQKTAPKPPEVPVVTPKASVPAEVVKTAATTVPKSTSPKKRSTQAAASAQTDDPLRALLMDESPKKSSAEHKAPAASASIPTRGATDTATPAAQPIQSDSQAATGVEWIADMMEKCIKSVWIVRTPSGSGTGFFISKDGYFLTNRHVVYDGETPETSIYVESNDESKKYKSSIVKVSKTYDVALLKVVGMPTSVPALPLLRDFSKVRPGCDMMIIGNGFGYGLAPITGTVKYPKAKRTGNMIYTALTNNGDSGSPVLNRSGFVIGIHKSTTNSKTVGNQRIEAKGMSNATPVCDILRLLDEWGVKI